ncbi:MAG: hypothetical protein ACOYN4_19630, partial [Bacteroidales bacterium]
MSVNFRHSFFLSIRYPIEVRLCLGVFNGQFRRATTSRQKSPPLVPLGLHGPFVGFRTIHASLPFSVTLFAINPSFTVMFFQNHYFNPPTRSKKDAPEKAYSKLLYITCSCTKTRKGGSA